MKEVEKIDGYTVVCVEKDEIVNIVGVSGSRFKEYTTNLGNNKYRANIKILLLVNYSNDIIKNIIDCIPYTDKYNFNTRVWNRLRRGCIKTNKKAIRTISGLVPFTRFDEFSIKKSNSDWYIVKKSEIGELLENVPAEHVEYKVFYIIKRAIGHYYLEPDYTTEERVLKMVDNHTALFVSDDEAIATKKLIEMNGMEK